MSEMQENQRLHISTNPLLQIDFLIPLVKHFANEDTKILSARESGELRLVLPMQRSCVGIWQSFSPSQLPITPLFVSNEVSTLPSIQRGLRETGVTNAFIELLHYDEKYLPRIDVGNNIVDIQPYFATMSIDATQSFSKYWQDRSKKLRDNIGRYLRRVASEGFEIGVIEHRTSKDVRQAFERYADIESAGWKGRINTSIKLDSSQGRFYKDVLERFASNGRARILELLFDGKVVSSRIGIQQHAMIVFLKTTYDEHYSKYSPGRLLLYRTIERLASDHSVDVLEFYTKATKDQAQWASSVRDINHVMIYRSFLIQKVAGLAREVKAHIRRTVLRK